eukprot:4362435-Pleurochrysis_carterae.AAC.1
MQTDPVGIKFMLATPSLGQDPGVEVWKGEEGEDGWNREKVEKDVLEVAREDGCSDSQVCCSPLLPLAVLFPMRVSMLCP